MTEVLAVGPYTSESICRFVEAEIGQAVGSLAVQSLLSPPSQPLHTAHLKLMTDYQGDFHGDYGWVQWRGVPSEPFFISSDPLLTQTMMVAGPATFDVLGNQTRSINHVHGENYFAPRNYYSYRRETMRMQPIIYGGQGIVRYGSAVFNMYSYDSSNELSGLPQFKMSEAVNYMARENGPLYMDTPHLRFDWLPAYKTLPQVREAISNLGFERGDKNPYVIEPIAFPAPGYLSATLDRLRVEDKESGLSYPRMLPVLQGLIDVDSYLLARQAGWFPVSAVSFGYYHHDAASFHLVAELLYGDDLTDLCQIYSTAVLADPDKSIRDEAVDVMDTITAGLGMLDPKKTTAETMEVLKSIGRGKVMPAFVSMLATIRRAGRLADLAVCRRLLESQPELKVEDISAADVVGGMLEGVRQRLHIEGVLS